MAIREIFSRTRRWLGAGGCDDGAAIGEGGVIAEVISPAGGAREYVHEFEDDGDGAGVVLEAVAKVDKREPIEKLEEGFGSLIEQLEGINGNLARQMSQHEELMNRVEKLPRVLESFPLMVENQRQLTDQMLQQLALAAAKSDQFLDAVDRIPAETARQTDALVNIDHQLAAAADTDVQMVENFNKFNSALDSLNNTASSQTDSICQLSRTFATSDRYLKYILSRQSRRFFWVFMVAMGVCVTAIGVLAGVLIYVMR